MDERSRGHVLQVSKKRNNWSRKRNYITKNFYGIFRKEFLKNFIKKTQNLNLKNILNKYSFSFFSHLINSFFNSENNQIRFNSKGDRIQIAYEVLNKQDERNIVVGYVDDQSDLTLHEKNIIWPGMTRTKPLEITLPKYLRAVTVPDPPFVYTVSVDDPRKCSTFETIFLEDIYVPGPWLPCPLKKEDKEEMYCCAGYAIDLLSNLSVSEPNSTIDTGFNFDIHLNLSYGIALLSEDGYMLNGVVGELDSDTADIAIGALTINPERENYIDFSEPWMYHGIKVMEKWVRVSGLLLRRFCEWSKS